MKLKIQIVITNSWKMRSLFFYFLKENLTWSDIPSYFSHSSSLQPLQKLQTQGNKAMSSPRTNIWNVLASEGLVFQSLIVTFKGLYQAEATFR